MDEHNLPYNLVKRLISISLVFGLVGGAAGGYLIERYLPGSKAVGTKQQIVLQDAQAVTDVVKNVSPSVVSVTSLETVQSFSFFGPTTNQQQGAGSGIILTEDGLIMTNKHVVSSDQASYSVITNDGKEYKNAKVLARDPINDVAFVKIDAHGLKPAELGDSSTLEVGQRVLAIGNALGQFANSASEGIISGLGRPITAGDQFSSSSENLTDLIQTDAAINPGNSGGPLVNIAGQVIGMNTAVAGNAQNIGFSIPINEVQVAIKSVRAGSKISHPYLGVRYTDLTPDLAASKSINVTKGAYITGDAQSPAVIAGSPAASIGLKDGDVITKINNDAIDSTHSLTSLIGRYNVGDKVKVTYVRDGKEQTGTATLAEAPSS